MKTKRKTEDDDAQGGAASGTGLPAKAKAHVLPELVVDQARALVAIARNGGGVAHVALPDSVSSATTIALRTAGLIDTLPNMSAGRARVKLTSFGVQRLVEAQNIVMAAPGYGR